MSHEPLITVEDTLRKPRLMVVDDQPVIFVTAHNDEAAETQGLKLGAVGCIGKPVNWPFNFAGR